MVTPAQASANVKSATRLLAQRLGLYVNDGSGFSAASVLNPNDQIALTNALADYIAANPALFDTGANDLTNPILSAPQAKNQALQDTGMTLGDFETNVLGSFRADLVSMGKYLLAAAVVVALGYVITRAILDHKAPATS